jgi:hypothetical protein
MTGPPIAINRTYPITCAERREGMHQFFCLLQRKYPIEILLHVDMNHGRKTNRRPICS